MNNKIQKIIFSFLMLCFLMSQISSAEMYIWTDKDGITHCSNTGPPEQVEEVQEQNEIERSSVVVAPVEVKPKIDTNKGSVKKPSEKIDPQAAKITEARKKINEAREKVKETWQECYGEITGVFESGFFIKKNIRPVGDLKRFITLSDDSIWIVVLPYVAVTSTWIYGTEVSLNKKDGIIYRNSNPDSWVKVFPKQ